MKTSCTQHDKLIEARTHVVRAIGLIMTTADPERTDSLGLHWILTQAHTLSDVLKELQDCIDEHKDS